MEKYQNYKRSIYRNTEEALSKIANHVTAGSRVLDVGCGAGMLGEFLTVEKSCIVDGVDGDSIAMALARTHYRKTAVKNLEVDSLFDVFDKQDYDFVVVADVLEHLINPEMLLFQLRQLVKPEGTILFSVPNITHVAVALEMLFGGFGYRNNGLLDSTHVRFFTRDSLIDQLKRAGLFAIRIETIQKAVDETEFTDAVAKRFPQFWLKSLIANRVDALTYQWIVSAQIAAPALGAVVNLERAPSLDFSRRLYWRDRDETAETEETKLVAHLVSSVNGQHEIEFHFSEAHTLGGVTRIRIDPTSDKTMFLLTGAEIVDQSGNSVWTWNKKIKESEIYNGLLIDGSTEAGALIQPTGVDPYWVPTLDASVLRMIQPGFIFKLSVILGDSVLEAHLAYHRSVIEKNRLQIEDHQLEIRSLRAEVNAIVRSKSWRITRPLRIVVRLQKIFIKGVDLYKKFRHLYPGFRGHSKLVWSVGKILMTGGFSGLKNRALYYDGGHYSQHNNLPPQPSVYPIEVLDEDISAPNFQNLDVAVHAHIFYPELAADIREYLQNIPVPFHLYVTTDTEAKRVQLESVFSTGLHLKSSQFFVVDNRGRDVAPFLVGVGRQLSAHDLVLHIHTKKSPQKLLRLAGWRRYLMEMLLGTKNRVAALLQLFLDDPDLGLLFPEHYAPVKPFVYDPRDQSNEELIKTMLTRSGVDKKHIHTLDRKFYSSGNMFWIRGRVLASILKLKLSTADFEAENKQLNGTLAHALERLFPFFTERSGLKSKAFTSKSFHSTEISAHELSLLGRYVLGGLIRRAVIIFDHNGGGGTNLYTAELVDRAKADGGSVVRVYCENGLWFIQWLADGDGMLFQTGSVDELFDALGVLPAAEIIVNSLYGAPDIEVMIIKIVDLKKNLGADLDIKVHDFFAVCPSPHLADFEGKYCGVPKEKSICANCLRKNIGWFHPWVPKQNRPQEIDSWRANFNRLFEAATQISFFDRTSVDILRLAYSFESSKVAITPHKLEHFKKTTSADLKGPLRIGFLGTLSHTKGAEVLNSLHDFITENKLNVPITVIGPSVVATPKDVFVHGFYDHDELPSLIKRYGINMILMPSIVPETFSYTISEAMQMSLPIVTFDLGAQGNRVSKYSLGKVVPFGSAPEKIFEAAQSLLRTAKEKNKQ